MNRPVNSVLIPSAVSASATHRGQVKANNEDAVFTEDGAGLYILADGMGGHQAGEVASALAVEAVRETFKLAGRGGCKGQLKQAVLSANSRIYQQSLERSEQQGMGTTLVVLRLFKRLACWAGVGDSRLYRRRDGRLEQLTQDHTVLAERQRSGHAPAPGERLMYAHVLTRSVGYDPQVNPDVCCTRLRAGDLFLLCSDGLTDVVDDETINAILNEHPDEPTRAAQRLVELANTNGGPDNISVIITQVRSLPAMARKWLLYPGLALLVVLGWLAFSWLLPSVLPQ